MSCPICKKPSDPAYKPFCSKHCADVDLARWFKGGYSIPSTDPEDIEKLIEERNAARKTKDWARADALRQRLKDMGIVLEDSPKGTTWRYDV